MARKRLDNGGIDRISSLPLHILHDIMSFLPTEDVIRTGALSKAWNGVCVSYPILDFDEARFSLGKSLLSTDVKRFLNDKPLALTALERFLNHINTSLIKFSQQKVRMQKLSLKFVADTGPITPLIIEWIKLALLKEVEEIYISSVYRLYIMAPNDIPVLPLTFQFSPEKDITFNSVKKVDLYGILLDEATFENLFSVCPLIEDLKINETYGFGRLHIPKAAKRLAKLSVESPPHLESVDIDTDSIRELTIYFACCNSPLILASSFPVLEDLRIRSCHFDNGLQIISPSLKVLELVSNDVFGNFEIDTRNLCSFKYSDVGIPLDIMIAPCQWKFKIREYYKTIETSWFVDLKKFLARSTQVIKFGCDLNSCDVSFSLKDAEETNLTPIPAVEKMCLVCEDYDDIVDSELDYAALLNGLLWCCHPKMILVDCVLKFLIELLYEQSKPKDDPLLCCSLTPVKCWRHYVKGVKWHQTAKEKIWFELTW